MKSTNEASLNHAFTIRTAIVLMIASIGLSCGGGTQIKPDPPKGDNPRTEASGPVQPASKAEGSKISAEEAVKIALKAVPGKATGVTIERKLGANRYVVEVIAKADGVETDVIIDMETGKVLDTEK